MTLPGDPIFPKTLDRAVESLLFRTATVIRYLACRDEIRFLRQAHQKKSDANPLFAPADARRDRVGQTKDRISILSPFEEQVGVLAGAWSR